MQDFCINFAMKLMTNILKYDFRGKRFNDDDGEYVKRAVTELFDDKT